MNNKEMKKMAIKASVFALISISVMLHRAATKQIMITDAAVAPVDVEVSESTYPMLVDRKVPVGKENTLIIPLSKSVHSDNIVLEDVYADHELKIYIDSLEPDFYKSNPVRTDLNILKSATCTAANASGKVCLSFKLDGLYANESSLAESNTIEVKFYAPSDRYDHIVVVDSRAGGNDNGVATSSLSEKDVTLKTALLLKSIADNDSENGIKFYFTRLSDLSVDQEERIGLISESGADLVVEISVEAAKSSKISGLSAYYNDIFFKRTLTNADLADKLLRNCALKTGAQGLGIYPMGDMDFLLKESVVPSARLVIGYLPGDSDMDRLSSEAYMKKVAEGIYAGILEAYEVMR